MRFLTIFSLIGVFLISNLSAKGLEINEPEDYSVTNIPGELLEDADAVIRNHSKVFEIDERQSVVETVTYAVTIFNKNKQDLGELYLFYDEFIEIMDIEGTIFDKTGKEIRSLDSDNISDFSNFTSFSLYEDNRIKKAELYYDIYPYTVEFRYEINYEKYLSWPTWYSQDSRDPVQYSKLEVIVPSGYNLRYWSNIPETEPVIIYSDTKTYLWDANNLPKLPEETKDEDFEDLVLIVKIAPTAFEIDGFAGNLSSWKDFGRWYYSLSESRDILPDKLLNQVNEISNDCSTTKEKIKKLYQYMQSTTRYVSIQLGIGGWQPFDAETVYNNGYGDCKALSNYMISLLKAVDIKSYPVLIRTGNTKYPFIEEFPSNQFNHVIVCVPVDGDTIWLECTNPYVTAGNIGWSNENRKALMIHSSGGEVVCTPSSQSMNNSQVRNLHAIISTGRRISLIGYIEWNGNQQNNVLSVIENYSHTERKKWIKKKIEAPDVKLDIYNFNEEKRDKNKIYLELKADLINYSSKAGNRIFFNPVLIERVEYVPEKNANKISSVRFNYPYKDIDSIFWSIPDNYKVEAIPNSEFIETSFGKFKTETSIQNNELLYIRELEIKSYSIPSSQYNEYRDFFSAVTAADRMQVVLVKK